MSAGSSRIPALLFPIKQLRSENHAALKDDLMMTVLKHLDWFKEYREALKAYRMALTHGVTSDVPTYPTDAVESVEIAVDELIRRVVDPNYTR